jgi:rhodanese-related sulfurtransferase
MKNLILILTIAFTACSTTSQKESFTDGVKVNEKLDVATFDSKLNESPEAILVDVRTPEEFAEGNISGAQNINFNASDFEQKISALDKNKTYFVYCKAGTRSAKAVSKMSELGFTSLYSLDGGYMAWKEKGN